MCPTVAEPPSRDRGRHLAATILRMRCNVLIVDDDEDVRELMARYVGMEGFEVRTAVHGNDALAQLISGLRPQVILLDIMMPVMDGRALLNHLRRTPATADIPVIVLSAIGGLLQDFDAAGITVFSKPIDFGRLMDVVRQYCEADHDEDTRKGGRL
jgi:CheY-like chemotaxis protein